MQIMYEMKGKGIYFQSLYFEFVVSRFLWLLINIYIIALSWFSFLDLCKLKNFIFVHVLFTNLNIFPIENLIYWDYTWL